MKDDNTVFIGGKPVMNYVLAVVTQLNSGTSSEVVIKARGRAISRAVDVAEIVRRKFMPGLKVASIVTSTEEVARDDGTKSAVSAMEITLKQ
ncbi:MAG: DNA-binding protein Alba [Theionarchaea archaeon]|nr:DNA-binding protein Alba [Theionarchaea archaeon]MBU7037615.1 DNA-binding protein Alba [Theionarchaea archaeon]